MREFVCRRLAEGHSLFYTLAEAMHTRFEMLWVGENEKKAQVLSEGIVETLENLERRYNRFDPDSLLSRVNREAVSGEVEVDRETFRILESVRDHYLKTDGLFDVTATSSANPGGADKILLDPSRRSVRFDDPHLGIDLGGYLKGYALARIEEEFLEKEGIGDAFVNFGNSSILARGNHPYGSGWKAGIADALEPGNNVLVLDLNDECLSVSGNTPGASPHIVDPKKKEKVPGLRAVCIATKDPCCGEVLSTAVFAAAGKENGQVNRMLADYGPLRACEIRYRVNYPAEIIRFPSSEA